MDKKPIWDNQERRSYYGLRVGDTVISSWYPLISMEVMAYGFMDNNRICLEDQKGNQYAPTAESCTIITKVEDKEQ